MASGTASEEAKASLTGNPKTKKKSVQIMDNRDEIVEVTEKHGSLYNAIPCMPIGAAAVCCILNILVPGLGKSGQLHTRITSLLYLHFQDFVNLFIDYV